MSNWHSVFQNSHSKKAKPEEQKSSSKNISVASSWKSTQITELGSVEKFFDTSFSDMIFKSKWIILIASFLMTAYSGFRVTEIRGLSEFEAYFPDDHLIVQSFNQVLTGFNEGN